jgi:hypothetical protein
VVWCVSVTDDERKGGRRCTAQVRNEGKKGRK